MLTVRIRVRWRSLLNWFTVRLGSSPSVRHLRRA